MNQESFIQSSQAMLQGLVEGGFNHTKTPKLECFFRDEKKNKLDFDMWERQILSAATTFRCSHQTSHDAKFERTSINGDLCTST